MRRPTKASEQGSTPMAEEMTGGCACGRVRYAAQIDDDEA
jgi:hypothetical protein